MRLRLIRDLFLVLVALAVSAITVVAQSPATAGSKAGVVEATAEKKGKRALTFLDVMKFRNIKSPVLAPTGTAVAYQSQPDRGDGEVVVYDLAQKREHRIARGLRPVFSADGKWVAILVAKPVFAATEPKPMQGLVLLELRSGKRFAHERVQSVAFSKDSAWVASSQAEQGRWQSGRWQRR